MLEYRVLLVEGHGRGWGADDRVDKGMNELARVGWTVATGGSVSIGGQTSGPCLAVIMQRDLDRVDLSDA